MLSMNLILKEKKDDSLNLVLPLWFRGIFLFIVILLGAGFITSSSTTNWWIPAILILVSLTGTLYEEKWIFSKSLDKIEYKTGLVIFNKKSSYNMSKIEKFLISGTIHTAKGKGLERLRKTMMKFSLVLDSGEVLDIEIVKGKTESDDLKIKAEKIASYCGVQLTVDSGQWTVDSGQ